MTDSLVSEAVDPDRDVVVENPDVDCGVADYRAYCCAAVDFAVVGRGVHFVVRRGIHRGRFGWGSTPGNAHGHSDCDAVHCWLVDYGVGDRRAADREALLVDDHVLLGSGALTGDQNFVGYDVLPDIRGFVDTGPLFVEFPAWFLLEFLGGRSLLCAASFLGPKPTGRTRQLRCC